MSSHAFTTSGDHCPYIPVFGPPQVMFVRGLGTELWDVNGKRYLDFLCGIAVTSLGHSNPVVVEAITKQAQTLMHVSNFFANPVATETAVLINQLLGGSGQVFFCNSGAEANEAAIKLARKFGGRGRHTVVSALGSFHGRTLAALAATGQPAKHEPFQPMPEGFRHVPFNDIGALDAAVDNAVAAVLIEPVQGEGGVLPANLEFLQAAQKMCTERGVLLMLDEVQTGFGRTGKWFGFEHYGISPDVVLMAKAMGNGMPIGAMWAKRSVSEVFKPGDHGSTFSGTAIATSAAKATILEMQRIDAPRLATEKGALLTQLVSKLDNVSHVRGLGLLLGVELAPGIDAKQVQLSLLELGLVTNAVTASALRLAPPITVTTDEIHEAVSMIASALKGYSS